MWLQKGAPNDRHQQLDVCTKTHTKTTDSYFNQCINNRQAQIRKMLWQVTDWQSCTTSECSNMSKVVITGCHWHGQLHHQHNHNYINTMPLCMPRCMQSLFILSFLFITVAWRSRRVRWCMHKVTLRRACLVLGRMTCLRAGMPSWYETSHPGQLSLAIPPWIGTSTGNGFGHR